MLVTVLDRRAGEKMPTRNFKLGGKRYEVYEMMQFLLNEYI